MKTLLVFGDKTFRIVVPDDAKITFGPFSPPRSNDARGFGNDFRPVGTLRIYQGSKENIVALFTNVHGFRDISLDYQEQVAKEEGATIWKSDKDGYQREERLQRSQEWVDPIAELPKKTPRKRRNNV